MERACFAPREGNMALASKNGGKGAWAAETRSLNTALEVLP
jgi:hypothetical protein